MQNFTPWLALTGGLTLGLSAAFLLLVSGRLSGMSGILQGLLPPFESDVGLRIVYVVGLISAPFVVGFISPDLVPDVEMNASMGLLIVAGLLVGFGTRLGSGCTSGHGICGVPRLSGRSIIATAIFFSVAVLVVFILRLSTTV